MTLTTLSSEAWTTNAGGVDLLTGKLAEYLFIRSAEGITPNKFFWLPFWAYTPRSITGETNIVKFTLADTLSRVSPVVA